jgi:hypothetical protein
MWKISRHNYASRIIIIPSGIIITEKYKKSLIVMALQHCDYVELSGERGEGLRVACIQLFCHK